MNMGEVRLSQAFTAFEKVLEHLGLEDFSIEIDFENNNGGYSYHKSDFIHAMRKKWENNNEQ